MFFARCVLFIQNHQGLNVKDATGGFALIDMAHVVTALGKLDGSAGKVGATLNFADIGTIVNCGESIAVCLSPSVDLY